jgi:hypothetical protein
MYPIAQICLQTFSEKIWTSSSSSPLPGLNFQTPTVSLAEEAVKMSPLFQSTSRHEQGDMTEVTRTGGVFLHLSAYSESRSELSLIKQ